MDGLGFVPLPPAGFLLMKSLHQGDGADDALKFKLPLGPAGPDPSALKGTSPKNRGGKKGEEAIWFSFPRLRLRNASLRSAPEHTNALDA